MIRFPRWKIVLIALVCAFGFAFAAPNLLTPAQRSALPSWLPNQAMNLGLDLRGGSHLLLEVDVRSIFRERLTNLIQSMRTELRRERIPYRNIGAVADAATVTIIDPDKAGPGGTTNIDRARQLLRGIEQGIELQAEDGGKVTLRYSEEARRERLNQALVQSIEIVRRRVDEFGTTEPTIQRQGEDRILVQLPGVDDPERVKRLIGRTAKMTFHLVDDRFPPGGPMPATPPAGTMFTPLEDARVTGGQPVMYVIQRRVMVSGDTLVDSQPTYDQGQPVVSFRFDSIGARKFAQATQQNVGKPFAIVLDGKIISAPVIREPILGGSGIITGGFTVEEAQDLSVLLRAGALPAPMTILEERTVGPDLGADSIAAGEIACIIGFILVVVFMVLAYSTFGLFANVALIMNLIILVAAMSLLQATLTLPGIAGIVLTMGMAVDANVLIFERIREETRLGRSMLSAIDAGYQRAFSAIIDSNLTTLIAAILLFEFGTGPVRGFAVTLAIGLMTSMFTAIMLARFIIAVYVGLRRPKALPI
jgi:preprotein translocase subunit SecD